MQELTTEKNGQKMDKKPLPKTNKHLVLSFTVIFIVYFLYAFYSSIVFIFDGETLMTPYLFRFGEYVTWNNFSSFGENMRILGLRVVNVAVFNIPAIYIYSCSTNYLINGKWRFGLN